MIEVSNTPHDFKDPAFDTFSKTRSRVIRFLKRQAEKHRKPTPVKMYTQDEQDRIEERGE